MPTAATWLSGIAANASASRSMRASDCAPDGTISAGKSTSSSPSAETIARTASACAAAPLPSGSGSRRSSDTAASARLTFGMRRSCQAANAAPTCSRSAGCSSRPRIELHRAWNLPGSSSGARTSTSETKSFETASKFAGSSSSSPDTPSSPTSVRAVDTGSRSASQWPTSACTSRAVPSGRHVSSAERPAGAPVPACSSWVSFRWSASPCVTSAASS